MLEDSRYENRAIYLISDFQEAGLQGADESWKLAPGVALYLIDVGSADSKNLVLTDVRSPSSCLRILLNSKFWLESARPGHSILRVEKSASA